MLDTPRTWRYQSAVLLGPRPNLPDQPNRGPEEGWGAPFERPFARMVLHGSPAAENSFVVSLLYSLGPGNLKLALARQSCSCRLTALNKCRYSLPAPFRVRRDRCVRSLA